MRNANIFLNQIYTDLDYKNSDGFHFCLGANLTNENLLLINWIEQALELNAEAIHFVDNFPAVLFFNFEDKTNESSIEIEEKIRKLFLKVWNTGKAPLFFVSLPNELRVYSSYQLPTKENDWKKEDRWLHRITNIAQIYELIEFSRSEVESGNLFDRRRENFQISNKVDAWLLRNLRQLRQELQGNDFQKKEYIHALIGRSIFIRYLEQRGILVSEYFLELFPEKKYDNYIELLTSKTDTYTFFKRLREDFNGDLFPLSEKEERNINGKDLRLLRDFLVGKSIGGQPDLLFWAYDFEFIPTELISNIYEEFYHSTNNCNDNGTHYTPSTLVDFVLSQVLPNQKLQTDIRILDPACGSGIFLVEAYKKMVYHARYVQNKKQLTQKELKRLLTKSIFGFDTNQSAIQIAAFSLYLAYLDFQRPPDIRENKKLPKLIYDHNNPEESGANLFHTDAFNYTNSEFLQVFQNIEQQKSFFDKESKDYGFRLPLENTKFDVIVGNPPWGSISSTKGSQVLRWCNDFNYKLGDKELSQAFILRMQHLVKDGGIIGLLVSTGVFFKHHENSKIFRENWLSNNIIYSVFNFSHVRKIFFQKAISPFAAIFYTPSGNTKAIEQNHILYCTLKQHVFIENTQAVIINKNDIRNMAQKEVMKYDWLWKINMWGNQYDIELIQELKECYPKLRDVISDSGEGYIEGKNIKGKTKLTSELGVNHELQTKDLYKNIDLSKSLIKLTNRHIHRVKNTNIYFGPRILIKRGISKSKNNLGEIKARLVSAPFAFRSSLMGFRIDELNNNERNLLLAILLSSLTKYYLFMTCSTWGLWHDEVHLVEYLDMPVCLTTSDALLNKISQYIDNHCHILFNDSIGFAKKAEVQEALDELVFSVYNLSDFQIDLIKDFAYYSLDYYYKGSSSFALKFANDDDLLDYNNAFLEIWDERLLERKARLKSNIYRSNNSLIVVMVFTLVSEDEIDDQETTIKDIPQAFQFNKIENILLKKFNSQIFYGKVIQELTEDSIILIKRSDKRLWSKSIARQDAWELLTEVFKLEWENEGSDYAMDLT